MKYFMKSLLIVVLIFFAYNCVYASCSCYYQVIGQEIITETICDCCDNPIQVFYNPMNNHYYTVIQKPLTWDEAKIACEDVGGHLVTVSSDMENNWIIETFGNKLKQTWMGGYQPNPQSWEEPEQGWEWVTDEYWYYDHWADSSPNNKDGIENCLIFWGSGGELGDWQDYVYNSYKVYGYVVEWESEDSIISCLEDEEDDLIDIISIIGIDDISIDTPIVIDLGCFIGLL